MTATTAPVAVAAAPRTARPSRVLARALRVLSGLGYPVLVLVLIIVGALVPMLFVPHFYWTGDTESGAYGQWYQIGTRVLHGGWSDVLNPTVWQAGVYVADGAWGFYSPLLWAFGLIMHSAEDILLTIVVLKVAILCAAGLGTYVLARTFRIVAPWAALAAVAVPFGGFTSYQDITSWITGALSWSLFPWAWAGLRMVVHRNWNIFAALVPAGLLLGIVYTHATLMLVGLVIAVGIESLATRRGPAIVRYLVTAVLIAIMVVIAHLPALLVYPDAGRAQGIINDGSLVATMNSLFQVGMPFGAAVMGNTGGDSAGHALSYMAWFLPLAALVDWRRCWRLLRRASSLPIFTLLVLVAIQAPSQVGPLRWPARVLPYATIAVVLLVVFGLARARVPRPAPIRFASVAVLLGFSTWITWVRSPNSSVPLALDALGLLVGLAIVGFGLSAYGGGRRWLRRRIVLAVACLLTIAVVVPQHAQSPVPGGPVQGLALSLSTYKKMLGGSRGDVFVVGNERKDIGTAMSHQASLGNSWYLTGKPVQNTYATLQYAPYTKLLCMGVKGSTCSEALYHLFDIAPGTNKRWVDLFGISSLLLIKASFFTQAWKHPRVGFHLVSDTPETRLLVRDTPIAGAGDVVWTPSGTAVRADSVSDTSVRFTVLKQGAGSRVAFGRLPWPGYVASGGATIAATPTADMLLTVDLPANAVGRSFTLTYEPPGYPQLIAAAKAGGALLVIWLVLWVLSLVLPRRFGWFSRTAARGRSKDSAGT